ncbi:MAG TPA: hypothetical protein VJ385_15735 [Fibrobacteria bacterium]|nr:hypothetical protein [Fibrobacteria bacterium]
MLKRILLLGCLLEPCLASVCGDSAYVALKSAKVGEIPAAELRTFLTLDSLCAAETGADSLALAEDTARAVPSPDALSIPAVQPPMPVTAPDPPRRRAGGSKALAWVMAGVGLTSGLLFLVANARYNSISDECNPLFTLDLFKSEEECRQEAKGERSDARGMMTLTGTVALAGLAGSVIAAVASSAKESPPQRAAEKQGAAEKQRESGFATERACEDEVDRAKRFDCFRKLRHHGGP